MAIWKAIAGYEGYYEVSNEGEVRSVERTVEQLSPFGNPMTKNIKGKTLSPGFDPNSGYLHVTLYKDNKGTTFSVHYLVAKTFIPNPLDLPTVNHENGHKKDNHDFNLKWKTYSEQQEHSRDVLNNGKGEKAAHAKLTETEVLQIKISNLKQKELAKLFSVSTATISNIKNGKIWKHLP